MLVDELFPDLPQEVRDVFNEVFLGEHEIVRVFPQIDWNYEHRWHEGSDDKRPYLDTSYNGRWPIEDRHAERMSKYRGRNVDSYELYGEFFEWWWGDPDKDGDYEVLDGLYVKTYCGKRTYMVTGCREHELEAAIETLKAGPPQPPENGDDEEWTEYDTLSELYEEAKEYADRYLPELKRWLEYVQSAEEALESKAIDKCLMDWLHEELYRWMDHSWLPDWWNTYRKLKLKGHYRAYRTHESDRPLRVVQLGKGVHPRQLDLFQAAGGGFEAALQEALPGFLDANGQASRQEGTPV